ncbi:Flp pilus assembly protein CpaB [Tepidibacter hydrothermalis]|uniref:RcpC/CpaB family pilus assembly protein n=1 Tax=Tepidibacter hydrothermalis TaxID=3036126 RepID=A0ABY8EGG3_9FIRM|nr:RcpC/CpaB family pilus assembly protein [Tepidibacter hydrothermalis]WFD10859.1 RcpC/CpaB family pilus assembly protein [Tepidibacter hydrothermalis]
MKLLRNRTILGVACIVLSLIICFGLTPLFNNAIVAKTNVIRVSENIAKGELITSKKVQTVEVGGYNLPDSVLKNPENIIGKYAKADLYKGDYILNTKVSDNPLANYEYLYDFNGSERAISVSIKSFAAGLSGKLQARDIVSIMVSEYGELKETISPEQLQYVQVLAVTSGTGMDTDEYANKEDERIEKDKDLPATITFRASPEQAKLLTELEVKGKIHVVFVYRGNKYNSEKFLKEQAKILSGNEEQVVQEKNLENNEASTDVKTTENTSGEDDGNAEE